MEITIQEKMKKLIALDDFIGETQWILLIISLWKFQTNQSKNPSADVGFKGLEENHRYYTKDPHWVLVVYTTLPSE